MKILLPSIKLFLVAPEDIPRQPRIVLRRQWSGNPEREEFVTGGVETIDGGDVILWMLVKVIFSVSFAAAVVVSKSRGESNGQRLRSGPDKTRFKLD